MKHLGHAKADIPVIGSKRRLLDFPGSSGQEFEGKVMRELSSLLRGVLKAEWSTDNKSKQNK